MLSLASFHNLFSLLIRRVPVFHLISIYPYCITPHVIIRIPEFFRYCIALHREVQPCQCALSIAVVVCVGRREAEDGGAAERGSGGDLVAGADGLDDAQGHERGRSRLNANAC